MTRALITQPTCPPDYRGVAAAVSGFFHKTVGGWGLRGALCGARNGMAAWPDLRLIIAIGNCKSRVQIARSTFRSMQSATKRDARVAWLNPPLPGPGSTATIARHHRFLHWL